MSICRIVIESEELSHILWKRIQPYLPEFNVTEDAHLQDLHIHGVPYLLRGKWQPIGLNKVNKDPLIILSSNQFIKMT